MQADILVFLDQGLILTQACSKRHLTQKVFSSDMFLSSYLSLPCGPGQVFRQECDFRLIWMPCSTLSGCKYNGLMFA